MTKGSTTGSTALDQHSALVEAWACGLCARVHAEKAAADDCCKCSVCGTKFLPAASSRAPMASASAASTTEADTKSGG